MGEVQPPIPIRKWFMSEYVPIYLFIIYLFMILKYALILKKQSRPRQVSDSDLLMKFQRIFKHSRQKKSHYFVNIKMHKAIIQPACADIREGGGGWKFSIVL